MTGSMYAAIAGLRTHMQNLNVIGNNVANVNTQGYKSARAVFKTSIYTTTSGGSNGTTSLGGKNPAQIGYGANIGAIDIDMSTGNYSITGKSTDLMLDGEGFFLVGSKDIAKNFKGTVEDAGVAGAFTSLTLTRVGAFDVMPDGYLAKNEDGMCVYGFLCTGIATLEDVMAGKAKNVGDAMFSDQLVPLRVPRVYRDTEGSMKVGYPRAGGGIVPTTTTTTTVDGKEVTITIGDSNATEFNKKIEEITGGTTGEGGTGVDPLSSRYLMDYGSYLDEQQEVVDSDYSKASLTNITFDQKTGIISATCGDLGGQVITIGCVAVGNVTNPNGVTQIGDSYYKATRGAGELTISTMGGSGKDMGIYYVNGSLNPAVGQQVINSAGETVNGPLANAGNAGNNNATTSIHPGSFNMTSNDAAAVDGTRLRDSDSQLLSNGLEMSKTDLAQEIANMIITQRGYQANTRIVTVTDSMLEELVNMKR